MMIWYVYALLHDVCMCVMSNSAESRESMVERRVCGQSCGVSRV